MSPVIKFPDMRPPRRELIREPPPPSQFRRASPAIIASQPGVQLKRLSRRRLWIWLGVAVVLHAVVFLAIWLAPPLHIPWDPAPEDWVSVTALPPASDAAAPQGPKADSRPAARPQPAP
jgi:hypothetical protein